MKLIKFFSFVVPILSAACGECVLGDLQRFTLTNGLRSGKLPSKNCIGMFFYILQLYSSHCLKSTVYKHRSQVLTESSEYYSFLFLILILKITISNNCHYHNQVLNLLLRKIS